MKTKHLLLGDEALALGALHAGLSGVWAYPGTPSLPSLFKRVRLLAQVVFTASGVPTRRQPWRKLWV